MGYSINIYFFLLIFQQNHFRNAHGIKAVGRHIPGAINDFSELLSKYNVAKELVDTVRKCGYTEPTAIQRQALPCILEVINYIFLFSYLDLFFKNFNYIKLISIN